MSIVILYSSATTKANKKTQNCVGPNPKKTSCREHRVPDFVMPQFIRGMTVWVGMKLRNFVSSCFSEVYESRSRKEREEDAMGAEKK